MAATRRCFKRRIGRVNSIVFNFLEERESYHNQGNAKYFVAFSISFLQSHSSQSRHTVYKNLSLPARCSPLQTNSIAQKSKQPGAIERLQSPKIISLLKAAHKFPASIYAHCLDSAERELRSPESHHPFENSFTPRNALKYPSNGLLHNNHHLHSRNSPNHRLPSPIFASTIHSRGVPRARHPNRRQCRMDISHGAPSCVEGARVHRSAHGVWACEGVLFGGAVWVGPTYVRGR